MSIILIVQKYLHIHIYDSDDLVSRCTTDSARCLEFYEFGVHVLLSAGNGAEIDSLWIQGL